MLVSSIEVVVVVLLEEVFAGLLSVVAVGFDGSMVAFNSCQKIHCVFNLGILTAEAFAASHNFLGAVADRQAEELWRSANCSCANRNSS